jgi:signal transduction histidine kinase
MLMLNQLPEETSSLPCVVDFVGEPGREASLSTAVELARKLVDARLAWLMLPSDDSPQVKLVAVSEYTGERSGGPSTDQPLPFPISRSGSTAGSDVHGDSLVVSHRLPMPNAGLPEPYGDQRSISVNVQLENGSHGVLSAAEPLTTSCFAADAPARLRACATFIASYLAYQPAKQRIQELEREVDQLRQEVVRAEESERRRIARDLHDEIGHLLFSGILRLDLATLALPPDGTDIRAALDHVRTSLAECADATHRIISQLRPPLLDNLGLVAALQSLANQATEASGVEVELAVEGQQHRLPDALSTVVFRVMQESLTNIHKHARATRVQVRLTFAARRLTLRIEDNGVGIRAVDKRARPGVGLDGIRERVGAFGGSLTVGPRDGGGTVLVVKLLLPTSRGGERG